MKRFNDLDQLLDHIWTYVQEGAEQGFKHPFGTPTFVTAGPETGPTARAVTLLSADADTRTLTFLSDARAAKVEALCRDPSAAFHRWDPERREHLVLRGAATAHTTGDVAERMWNEAPPSALRLYLKPEAPGTPVEEPASGLEASPAGNGEVTRADVAAGREHFAVVQTVIDQIDWLHTHPEGHYRARFQWNGKAFDGDWVVP